MARRKKFKLKARDEKELKLLTHSGNLKARQYNRCQILLLSAKGKKKVEIAKIVGVATVTVNAILQRYIEGGLENALNEKPRPGAPSIFTGRDKAKITALACSTPPEGNSRWTLRLLSDRAVELNIVDSISYNTVARMLKKTT